MPPAVALVCALALVGHFALTGLFITGARTTGPVRSALDEYFRPVFSQNWMLFAPDPRTTVVAVRARARVTAEDGSVTTTGWVDLGHVPDTSSPWSNVEYTRAPLLVESGVRQLDDTGWSLARALDDDQSDVATLALDPAAPVGLVEDYHLYADLLTRLALETLQPAQTRPVAAVQLQELVMELPSFDRRRAPDQVTYLRELPWWETR